MSYANFVPEWWMTEIQTKLLKKMTYAMLANRNYQGELLQYGGTVKVNQLSAPTVNAYTKYSDITFEQLDVAQKELKIDTQKYIAFNVDDIDKAQMNVDITSTGLTLAAYELADDLDQYLAAMYGQAGISNATLLGSSSVPLSINSANVDELFVNLGLLMDEANVPTEGRVAVIPPWVAAKLTIAEVGLLTENREVYVNGYLGTINGFQLFKSNNVSEASARTNSKIMAFVEGMTFSLAEQVNSFEAVRREEGFVDGIKGLHVYGGKVMRPDTLATVYATYAAEA